MHSRELKLLGWIPIEKINSSNPMVMICLRDGSIVAGSFESNTLRRWANPLESNNRSACQRGELMMLNSYQGHTKRVKCVTQISSHLIASSGLDGSLRVWEIDSGVCLAINNIKASPFCILRLRNRLGKKERREYSGNGGWDGYPQFLMTGFKDGSIITCKVSRSGQLEQIQRSKGSGLAYCLCELDTDTHYRNDDGDDTSNKDDHDDGRDQYHLIVNSPWLVPRLYVWNAMTGEQVRWFVSHKTTTENNDTPITSSSLAFTRVMAILKLTEDHPFWPQGLQEVQSSSGTTTILSRFDRTMSTVTTTRTR